MYLLDFPFQHCTLELLPVDHLDLADLSVIKVSKYLLLSKPTQKCLVAYQIKDVSLSTEFQAWQISEHIFEWNFYYHEIMKPHES